MTLRILLSSAICSIFVIIGCGNDTTSPTNTQTNSAPQWGANYTPVVGDSLAVFRVDTNSLLSPGSAGSGVTWDFSAIVIDTMSTGAAVFVSPVGTPYASSFPAATIALFLAGSYFYDENTSSFTEVLGYGQQGQAVVYQHPLKTNLPMNYQDTQTDTGFYTNTLLGGEHVWQTQTITYDGVGTLKLPSGISYSNSIRLHIVNLEKDTTGTVIFISNSDGYEWFKPGYPLFVFSYSNASNSIGTGSTRGIEINKVATVH